LKFLPLRFAFIKIKIIFMPRIFISSQKTLPEIRRRKRGFTVDIFYLFPFTINAVVLCSQNPADKDPSPGTDQPEPVALKTSIGNNDNFGLRDETLCECIKKMFMHTQATSL
ncbi:hypothetical protein SSYM_0151, partial [Serratia symbiotica str. Tucson]